MRKSKKLKLKRTLFIFCEWETEKCYFEALKDFKRSNVNIKIEPFKFWQIWTTKDKVLKNIYSIYGKINYEFDFTVPQFKKTNSKVYLLLDADSYSKENITTIKNIFDKDDYIEVLFSNQDFELFILLHLEYFSWTTNNYIDRINTYYPDYEKWCSIKKREIHKNIIEKGLSNLKINIWKLDNIHWEGSHIKDKNPFSEVYKIYSDFE